MARNYGERLGKMRNFLATDEVPKTLFGIPIVSNPDEYTDADLAFFRKNPEAGGYYDLGSEDPWEATPDDGTDEGAPVQDDAPKTGGRTGEHAAQSSAPGFGRAEEAVKLLAKRLLAEVPGGTLIPAVARQRELDERERFEEWYKALPQDAKDEFKTLYFESGIWNPEVLAGAKAEFDLAYVVPGGDTERLHRMAAEAVATTGAGRIATVGRDLTRTKWFADLAREYGAQDARAAVELVSSGKFKDFFWQGNPEKVVADAAQYRKVSDIISKLGGDPDTGRALVGGSASINKWGTIKRSTAISHDLDINSYGAGASKVPWQPTVFVRTADGGEAPLSDWWYDRFVAPLGRPGFVENAPILDRIRKAYPDTHGNAPVLSWERGHKLADADYRYQEGIFRRIGYEPNVTAQAGANQFIGTRINGTPVDIFIADHRIDSVPGSPYAPAETAFGWKRAYAAENAQRGLPPRPKDVADMEMYRPFSAENPVVDPNTGRAQFSPSNFGGTILTEEGLPAVHNVETYPGSGEAVPMMMNTKGEMIYPFDPRVLQQDNMGGEAIKYLREKATFVDPNKVPKTEPVPELTGADLSAWAVVLPNNEQDKRVAMKANLKHKDVVPVFTRDEKTNKVTGYATTESLIVRDWNRKGREFYAVIPTVFKDPVTEKVSRHDAKAALEQYRRTGNSWGGFYDYNHANKVSQAVHQNHQAKFRRDWNAYTFTAPEAELGDNILNDPGVRYFRGLVDRAYDAIRPEESWDEVSVPVDSGYRIGPGLLGTYYVAQPDSLRRELRVKRGVKMKLDSPEGVYAAKNYIANLLLARTGKGESARLLTDPERPYNNMQLTALSLGYHGGPSVVLDRRLLAAETDEDMRKALAGMLLDKVDDNGEKYAALGRRMREYEYMTGVPGSGPDLANYTNNQELKAHIKAMSGDGPGSYRDSPAYKRRGQGKAKKTTQRKGNRQ